MKGYLVVLLCFTFLCAFNSQYTHTAYLYDSYDEATFTWTIRKVETASLTDISGDTTTTDTDILEINTSGDTIAEDKYDQSRLSGFKMIVYEDGSGTITINFPVSITDEREKANLKLFSINPKDGTGAASNNPVFYCYDMKCVEGIASALLITTMKCIIFDESQFSDASIANLIVKEIVANTLFGINATKGCGFFDNSGGTTNAQAEVPGTALTSAETSIHQYSPTDNCDLVFNGGDATSETCAP